MKNDFSAAATLHFQNYDGRGCVCGKITTFSPESGRAAPPQWEGQGLRVDLDTVTLDTEAGLTWETDQCPPVREVDLPRGRLFSGN